MYSITVFILSLFILFANSKRIENELYLKTIKTDKELFKFYNPDFDDYLKLVDFIIESYQSKNISDSCEASLHRLKDGLNKKEKFALECK